MKGTLAQNKEGKSPVQTAQDCFTDFTQSMFTKNDEGKYKYIQQNVNNGITDGFEYFFLIPIENKFYFYYKIVYSKQWRDKMKKCFCPIFCAIIIFSFFGCEKTLITISSLSPKSKAVHMPSFTLTVNGSGFLPGSVIIFNGNDMKTQYLSNTSLTCFINSKELAIGDYSVLVRNPNGALSDTETFTITADHRFANPKNISCTSSWSHFPSIAIGNGDKIHVVFSHLGGIYYISSTDDGETWTQAISITGDDIDASRNAIDVDNNGNVYVVFETSSPWMVNFIRSTDNGNTWEDHFPLLPTSLKEPQDADVIADDSGNVYVVWDHWIPGVGRNVYLKHSPDYGNSWSNVILDVSGCADLLWNCYRAKLALTTKNHINVTWISESTKLFSLYFGRSNNKGASWFRSPISFAYPEGQSPHAISLNLSNHILVTWCDLLHTAGQGDISFTKSLDSGASWNGFKKCSLTTDANSMPDMAVDSVSNINVVWVYTEAPVLDDIYFSRSIDGGETWSTDQQLHRSTWQIFYGLTTDVDSNGDVYIVWSDRSEGYDQIYFTRSVDYIAAEFSQ